MNMYFYSGVVSMAAEKYVRQLRTSQVLSSIIVLPGGSRLNSHDSLKLRNGDVMLLFASTDKEFAELLTFYDIFEGFRVILIIHEHNNLTIEWGHKLKPRFITFVESDLADLEKVITKIKNKTSLSKEC